MKKSTMIIFIVALLVLGGVGFAIANMGEDKVPETTTTQDQDTNESQSADTNDTATDEGAGLEETEDSDAVAATITYGNSGFSPSSVTVKAGESIKVTNSSSSDLDFASDPHPVHTDEPELNAGSIAPGSSKTFKVSNKGTWGFHNHENENHEGTIIVQ
jgi:plastocyanin